MLKSKLKSKKGITAGTLVVIISVIAAFIIIASVIFGFMSKTEVKEAELLCKTSIDLRATTAVQAGGTNVALAPVLCKTQDKEIIGNREEIKSQLAYMMARCWWMFGEGRHEENLENPGVFQQMLGLTSNDNKCFLCYTATIDQNKIEGDTISMEEMLNYVIEKDHKDIKGLKYLDYFQSYGGPGMVVLTNPIEAEHSYGIVYMAKNKEGNSGALWKTALAGAVVSGVVLCSVVTLGACAAVVVVGAAAGGGYATYNDYFTGAERDLSTITLGELNLISTANCVKDLGGQ
ncbi:hypothetical protein HON71_03275 [Candidatus Woesearchaeota archaeon]|nr:hypothetical protein [Candidatus Woesearchaeota archaeon]